MEKLIRKEFNVNLTIPRHFLRFQWDKKIKIKVKQATIAQTLDYFAILKKSDDTPFALVALLEKFRGKSFTNTERFYLATQQDKLLEMMEDTYLYGVVSTTEAVPSAGTGIAGGPHSAFFISIASAINTPFQQLINEFTYEQIWDISNGVIRNANNATTDGQKINECRVRRQKFVKNHDMEEISKQLAEMRKKRKSFNN